MRKVVVLAVLIATLLTACGGGTSSTADPSASTATSAATRASRTTPSAAPTSGGGGAVGRNNNYPANVEADIVYEQVAGQSVALDACSPVAGVTTPTAAVVVIHGGGWVGGDKAEGKWRKLCMYFASQGFIAFSLNYRLVPKYPFPAAIDDIQAAVQWLRQPDQVSRFSIDPNRIGAFGGSAGANLAALLGTSGSGPTNVGSRVAAVVSMSGPMDLTQAGLTLADPDAQQQDTITTYLSCQVVTDCPDAAAASPQAQVDATDPPLFMTNSENETVPLPQATSMQAAMQAVGAPVTLDVIPGMDHSISVLETQPDLITQITQFFQTNLA